MAPEVGELLASARSLQREQIADLAYQLLRVLDGDSTEGDQPSVDAAWRVEFRRRIDDIDSGRLKLVSHEATVAQAHAVLARQRDDVRR